MVQAVQPKEKADSMMTHRVPWREWADGWKHKEHQCEHSAFGEERSVAMACVRRRSGVAGAAALCVAVLVLARGGAYDSFHAAAMLQLQQLTNWRTGVLGGKASLVTQCAKVVAACQSVCASESLSLSKNVCMHAHVQRCICDGAFSRVTTLPATRSSMTPAPSRRCSTSTRRTHTASPRSTRMRPPR